MPEIPNDTRTTPLQEQTVASQAIGARRVEERKTIPDGPGGTPQTEKTFEMGPRTGPDAQGAGVYSTQELNEILAGEPDRSQPPVFPAPADQPGPIGGTWDGYEWKANPSLHVHKPSEESLVQRAKNVEGVLSHLSVEQRLAKLEARVFAGDGNKTAPPSENSQHLDFKNWEDEGKSWEDTGPKGKTPAPYEGRYTADGHEI